MNGWAEFRRTVDENCGSRELSRKGNDPTVPIIPALNEIGSIQTGLTDDGELLSHPIAKAKAGSTNRPASVTWPPGTGRRVVNSPRHNMTETQAEDTTR